MLRTEFSFTLPKGLVGDDGTLHREGTMRLATARDEIEPLRSPQIAGPDDPYLTVLVLARVVTRLGTLTDVVENDIESLFAADLAFLQDLYGIINFGDPDDVAALQSSVLPPERQPDDGPGEAPAAVHEQAEDDQSDVEDGAVLAAASRRRGLIEEVQHSATG